MGVINFIVFLALSRLGPVHPNDIHSRIPCTIDTATKYFALDSKTTIFAVCPACHCTYKPELIPGSNQAIYPQFCDNKPGPGHAVCREDLLEGPEQKPKKIFTYHHFSDYLSGLLARPDLEKVMDERCDLLTQSTHLVADAFEATYMKEFLGSDGKLFLQRPDGEGRYAFVLNIDYFNPEGLKLRGAASSCGIISMACLNLPLDIRYKPENMYIAGIIPGPKEPHLTQLNHYIRPLIDDLLVSWERGVSLSRTALQPTGRTTRSIIAAVVCDLPAARKAAQMASYRSHFFCTVCSCYHLSSLGNFDYENWKKRDVKEMRVHAEQWRDAKTAKEQERLFEKYGVRWSELWRLPYWDPTRQLVVDSMHCLFENLAKTHGLEVLGLTTTAASKKEVIGPAFQYNFTKPPRSSSPEASLTPSIPSRSSSFTPTANPMELPSSESSRAPLQSILHPSSQSRLRLRSHSFTPSERTTSSAGTGSHRSIQPASLSPSAIESIAAIHKLLCAPVMLEDPESYFMDLQRKLSQKNWQALDFVYQNDIVGTLQSKPKRQRWVFDGVELPTLKEVNRRLASQKTHAGATTTGPPHNRQRSLDGSESSKRVKIKIETDKNGMQVQIYWFPLGFDIATAPDLIVYPGDSQSGDESDKEPDSDTDYTSKPGTQLIRKPLLRSEMADAMVIWVGLYLILL
jgi:hypothetical protein